MLDTLAPPATVHRTSSVDSRHVLLACDDARVASEVRSRVEDFFDGGVQLHDRVSLRDAEEAASRMKFDAVLLSTGLPDATALDAYLALSRTLIDCSIILLGSGDLQSSDGADSAMQAIEDGAFEFLSASELASEAFGRSLMLAMERTRRLHMERELQAAAAVQRTLYPKVFPILDAYDVYGAYAPAEQNCGDYFDFIPLVGGKVGIAVGDVSGHGLAPALMMSQTRAYLRSLTEMSDYLEEELGHGLHPGQLLTHTNRMLCQTSEEYFITMFFASLDPRTGVVRYASAGHRAYVIRATGDVEVLESTGPMLAAFSGVEIETAATVVLDEGDLLFAPTDGIEECMNESGEQFTVERMLAEASRVRHRSASNVIRHVAIQADRHRGRMKQRDDITAVVVKRTGE